MKCISHPNLYAIGMCVECGRGICADCKRELGGKFYCRTCADAKSQNRIAKCVTHPGLDIVGMCVECGKGICVECKLEINGRFYCQACADAYGPIQSDEILAEQRRNLRQTYLSPEHTESIAPVTTAPAPAGTAGAFDPSQDSLRSVSRQWLILAPLIALIGGVFGILGAAANEAGYGWYIAPFVAAPVIEEIVKPCGVYFLLSKKPEVLLSRRYTAFLAALSGLAFALIENAMYLCVYVPDPSQSLIIWRFTVCIALHTSCSYIVGLGINQRLTAWVRREDRFMGGNAKYFILAMTIHSAYNIWVTIIEKNLNWFS